MAIRWRPKDHYKHASTTIEAQHNKSTSDLPPPSYAELNLGAPLLSIEERRRTLPPGFDAFVHDAFGSGPNRTNPFRPPFEPLPQPPVQTDYLRIQRPLPPPPAPAPPPVSFLGNLPPVSFLGNPAPPAAPPAAVGRDLPPEYASLKTENRRPVSAAPAVAAAIAAGLNRPPTVAPRRVPPPPPPPPSARTTNFNQDADNNAAVAIAGVNRPVPTDAASTVASPILPPSHRTSFPPDNARVYPASNRPLLSSTSSSSSVPILAPPRPNAAPRRKANSVAYLPQPPQEQPQPQLPQEQQLQPQQKEIQTYFETLSISQKHDGSCTVCLEDRVHLIATLRCQHEPNVCASCMLENFKTEQTSKRRAILSCASCSCTFTYDEFTSFATTEAIDLYSDTAFKEFLAQDPNFVWCSAPDCKSGQVHEGGAQSNIVTCTDCKARTCFLCRCAFHMGETCAEAELKRQGDQDLQLLAETTKPCPKCSVRIEKAVGCDHMTCTQCGFQFCWLCMADYLLIKSTDNSAHDPKCKHHSDNIVG